MVSLYAVIYLGAEAMVICTFRLRAQTWNAKHITYSQP